MRREWTGRLAANGEDAPYACPVCGASIRRWARFRPGPRVLRLFGGGPRRLCPACGSYERTRHMVIWLRQQGLLEGRPRFLHCAPEYGLKQYLRQTLGDGYITTDVAMRGVDVHTDLTAMLFPDASFDIVYCSNVLEHIGEDRRAMAEIFRVLVPGGHAIIQVPIRGDVTHEDPAITTPKARAEHFGQSDHVRYYGRDIIGRLEKAGFHVEELHMPDCLRLDRATIARYHMAKREIVHWCAKPA